MWDQIKDRVGALAAGLVEPDMIVGLGTGSTASRFIIHLGKRCRNGLRVRAVATSAHSQELAQRSGIPLLKIDQVIHLDLTVDGADEVDPQKRMIKGGGGALLREKIAASLSSEMVVIVDERKLVSQLGSARLPIEIARFGMRGVECQLRLRGFHGNWRCGDNGELLLTENGNYIFDVQFDQLRQNPERDEQMIRGIPGVVETGFFFKLAGRLVIGLANGQVIIRE